MLLFKELPALFNGLASRVNAGADPSIDVAPWPTELITLKPTASANVNITTLVDQTHLDDWVKRNSPDGPLTPMSAPVRIPDTHRPSIPAGWHPDPTDNRALCWWDGEQWQPPPSAPHRPYGHATSNQGGDVCSLWFRSWWRAQSRVANVASAFVRMRPAAPPEVAPGGVERAAGPDQPMLTPPVPVPLPDQMPDDFGQQGPVTASAASRGGAEYQPAPSPPGFRASPSEHVERKRWPLFATIGAGAVLVIVAGVVLAPHWLQGNPSPTPAATNPATPSPTTATTNPATTSTSPGIGATTKVGDAPQGVALDSAGHSLYVANTGEVTGEYSVSVIDLTTWKVTATIPFQYTQPQDVAVDPSTHLLYVTLSDNTVSVIDTDTREAIATIAVKSPPFGLAVDSSTHTLYVSHLFNDSVSVIDTNTRKVTATIQVGDGPLGLALDPVRRALYVANTGQDTQKFTVSVVDVTTRKVTATIPSENNQPSAVAVNPSTHLLYVALPDNTVSVIDLTTRTVTDTIKVEDHATGLALDPDTQTLYATHRGSGTVSMIKLG